MGEQNCVLHLQPVWLIVGQILWLEKADCQGVEPGPSASLQVVRGKKEDIKLTLRIAKKYLCSIDKTIDCSQLFLVALNWSVIGRTKLRSRHFHHFFHSCLKPLRKRSPKCDRRHHIVITVTANCTEEGLCMVYTLFLFTDYYLNQIIICVSHDATNLLRPG